MTSELKQRNIRPVCAWDDGKTIYFVYRDKDKQKQIFELKDFEWYFCIQTKEYESEEGRMILKETAKKSMTRYLPKLDEVGNKMFRENGNLFYDKIDLPNPIKRVEKKGDFVKVYCDRYRAETKIFLRRLQNAEIETREADLNLTKRYMIDNMVDIEEDLSVLFFDIETNDINLGIEIGRNEIISWAACDNDGNIFFEKSDDVETGEAELILKMLNLFKKYDLIVGWNSTQFDIAYIKSRIDKLNITGEELGEKKINVNKTDFWKKIIHIDLMKRLIKLFGPMMTVVNLTGFSLNEVAKVFIGEQKIKHDEKVIDLYHKDPKKLEEYNKKDVLLVKQINDKLRTIPLMIKECFWTGTFMDRFYIGELLDNYILREANLQNFHLKTRPKWEENPETIKIRGGFVMEPKIGLYNNVRALDFKSMYPSIVVGWNIGQESLIEGTISDIAQKDFLKWIKERKIEEIPFIEWYEFLEVENKKLNPKNEYFHTANNQFFTRERPSIISGLIKKLLQERKAYKKRQLDSEYNSIEYKNSQASQEAVKEMSNSMYGITADRRARFFDPRIAEAITMTGQFLNRMTMAILEKMKYNVIYGDSVVGSTKVKANSKDISIEKLWDKYSHLSKKIKNKEIIDFSKLPYHLKTSTLKNQYEKTNRVNKFIRHYTKKDLYEIETESGKKITVTKDHSLIVNRNGKKCIILPTELNLETDKVYCKQYHKTSDGLHLKKFKKGNIPYNKRKKRDFKSITHFKKGQKDWSYGKTKENDKRVAKRGKTVSKSLKSYFKNNTAARQKLREFRLDQVFGKKTTKLEKEFEKLLKQNNLRFKKQISIERYCTPDFVSIKKKIAIFCDGDYWHANPIFYNKKDRIQQHNTKIDKRQNKTLKDKGWIVLRYFESDIYKNSKTVIKEVKKCYGR